LESLSENTRFRGKLFTLFSEEERMKKFWLVLLSLGLVMAFSVSAFAVDVKVSAEYYAAGLYLNKTQTWEGHDANPGQEVINPSTAFFYQRLRVGTDFVVSPCLKLVTRFDAMERIWGGARGEDTFKLENSSMSAGTRTENQNIAFDLAYIDYTSPIGQFKVGYRPEMVWGTIFADRANGTPTGQIQYIKNAGPFTFAAMYSKIVDNSWSAVSTGINATRTDRDADAYKLGGIYNFKGGEAGALLLYYRDATCRGRACDSYLSNVYIFDPYVKAKIGPVAIQAEAQYYFGDAAKYEGYATGDTNISIGALSVFVDAAANFGMFNVGGSFAYLSGDDPNTEDKLEGSSDYIYEHKIINTGGLDWNPCLLMFNNDLRYWAKPDPSGSGHAYKSFASEMQNAWFFQGRIGVKPTPQWDILLAVSYATADKKPEDFQGGTYGTEFDITGTYKITNNLSYMLGAGYLFVGDYFKGDCESYGGTSIGPKVVDDFILINKLTLTF
jgi:hypothetical protein